MLVMSRIRAGLWEGQWQGRAPALRVVHEGREIPGLAVRREGEGWGLSLPIPVGLLSEGVQVFLLCEGDEPVGRFTILAGAVLDDDLRAEVALLRAELDLLKQVVRRRD